MPQTRWLNTPVRCFINITAACYANTFECHVGYEPGVTLSVFINITSHIDADIIAVTRNTPMATRHVGWIGCRYHGDESLLEDYGKIMVWLTYHVSIAI